MKRLSISIDPQIKNARSGYRVEAIGIQYTFGWSMMTNLTFYIYTYVSYTQVFRNFEQYFRDKNTELSTLDDRLKV